MYAAEDEVAVTEDDCDNRLRLDTCEAIGELRSSEQSSELSSVIILGKGRHIKYDTHKKYG